MKTCKVTVSDPIKGVFTTEVIFYSAIDLAFALKPLLGDLVKGTKITAIVT